MKIKVNVFQEQYIFKQNHQKKFVQFTYYISKFCNFLLENVLLKNIVFKGCAPSLKYTTDRKYQISRFEYFVKSGFKREPLMLYKQMIPHFKPLDVGSKIYQEQLCSSIRDDHATFLVKNTLFKEEVA